MPKFDDALRGYAFAVMKRDGFTCSYCEFDGTKWPNWLFLSWDHLLPPGHERRDDPDFIVTACRMCNEFHNRTAFEVDGKTRPELVAQKRPMVLARREEYRKFWQNHVGTTEGSPPASASDR